uniref:Uncharacterized protein n=1 Tax=Tetradesmus obliquus TaxID=3088 RepID=A0A383VLI8_TETOB|eukprot:jgi/Sobl393_1/4212/SZX65602.1
MVKAYMLAGSGRVWQEAQQFDFPSAVLAHILSYVETRQRISSCACVSRAWPAAAVSVTTSITDTKLGCREQHKHKQEQLPDPDGNSMRSSHASSLAAWLQKHGSHLTQLMVSEHCSQRHNTDLSLPWQQLSQLQSLKVWDADLQSDAPSNGSGSSSSSSSGTGSMLAALQELTRLSLYGCTFPSTLFACGLPALTNLRHLEIDGVDARARQAPAAAAARAAGLARAEAGPAAVAAAGLVPAEAGPAAAAAAAAAAEVEEGRGDEDAEAPYMLAAAAALTVEYAHVLSCGLGHSLQALTQLTCLNLCSQLIQPSNFASLSNLQQLQHLKLFLCPGLNTCANAFAQLPPSLTSLQVINGHGGNQLDLINYCIPGVFAGLTRLQHLELVNVLGFEVALLAQLSSLTSFKLERERESGEFSFDPENDEGDLALLLALPQLHQLQQLQLTGVLRWAPDEQIDSYTGLFAPSALTALNLQHNELERVLGRLCLRLVCSCRCCGDCRWVGRGETQLWLTTVVAPGTPMAALTALTALTELAVGGDVVDDAVAMGGLGHMMQLQGRLGVFFSQTLSLTGWRQLNGMLGEEVQQQQQQQQQRQQGLLLHSFSCGLSKTVDMLAVLDPQHLTDVSLSLGRTFAFITDSSALSAALLRLSSLQRLVLIDVADGRLGSALTTLSQLRHLTSLEMGGFWDPQYDSDSDSSWEFRGRLKPQLAAALQQLLAAPLPLQQLKLQLSECQCWTWRASPA